MRPGGLHLMLVELARPLAVGDAVPLTLRTADGATIAVTARVRAP
jgi:copper(I)-binding protein